MTDEKILNLGIYKETYMMPKESTLHRAIINESVVFFDIPKESTYKDIIDIVYSKGFENGIEEGKHIRSKEIKELIL